MTAEAVAVLAELLLEALKDFEEAPTKETVIKLIERSMTLAVNAEAEKEFPGQSS